MRQLKPFLIAMLALAAIRCGGESEPDNRVEPKADTGTTEKPSQVTTIEPLGFETPEATIDAFEKAALSTDLATFKRLIQHCPPHLEAVKAMGDIHRALDFATREEAERNYLNKWVGQYVRAYTRPPHRRHMKITGDEALMIIAALHADITPVYMEIGCSRIDGKWYLKSTAEILDKAQHEKDYPIDELRRNKQDSDPE